MSKKLITTFSLIILASEIFVGRIFNIFGYFGIIDVSSEDPGYIIANLTFIIEFISLVGMLIVHRSISNVYIRGSVLAILIIALWLFVGPFFYFY